ncbi:hypothetical protein C8R43DRAFT_1165980 [Mycena crocata]|nr:hypothetical protein C8R43DRAFT_1165980 [Mycena crocata]
MPIAALAYGSFGDIVETIRIVVNVVEVGRAHYKGSSTRSQAQWSDAAKELNSLHGDLTQLGILSTAPLDQAIVTQIKEEVVRCHSIVLEIQCKITASGGLLHRLWHATSEESELAAFRTRLNERRVALNGVLGRLNITAVNGVQNSVVQVKDDVDGISQQLTKQEQTLSGAVVGVQDHVAQVSQHIRLGNDQIQSVVQDGLGGVTQKLTVQQQSLERSHVLDLEEKLEKWLGFPPRMAEKQHETQRLHHEGTGSWFLDGQPFAEWKEVPGVLWIEGRSGTGKTVLSSTVIRKLVDGRHGSVPTRRVAYFYFDFRDEKKQRVETMLRCIVLQLSAQSPNPYAVLDQLYETVKGQTLPTRNSLLKVLENLLLELGTTYLVLDALDECEKKDHQDLIQLISRVQEWTQSRVHLLMTSQTREIFTKAFDGVKRVALDFHTTEYDIERFVASELTSKHYLKHLKSRVGDVTAKVVERSNGMRVLKRKWREPIPNVLVTDTILANLPDDLFMIYDRFLEPIHPDDLPTVEIVLCWLLFSAEPVSLHELEDALAFDFSSRDRFVFDPAQRGNAVTMCELLEGLVASAYYRSSDNPVVHLAHSSVADYLLSDEFNQKHKYALGEARSHTFLAQSCIGYLLHFEDNLLDANTFPDYPLSMYAAEYWGHHLIRSHDGDVPLASAMHLLQSGSRQYITLNCFHNFDYPFYQNPKWSRTADDCPLPLYLCSTVGYLQGVRFFLALGADVNTADGKCTSALHAASAHGHTDIVRILLEHGADVNVAGGEYGSTLQAASVHGHTDIVRILLEHGADVNAAGGRYGSALQAASVHGRTDIVRILLEHGADVNAGGEWGSTLQIASDRGHTDIVQILLEHGADVNAAGGRYGSTLQAASVEGYTDIVQILLEHGADVNAAGGRYSSTLQAASVNGHTDIVRILLEHGADVNAAGGRYGSALQAASVHDHTDIVHILLEHGADVNAAGGRYGSALQAASVNGHTDIVHILLEHGADVNAAGGRYGSALQAASVEGVEEEISLYGVQRCFAVDDPQSYAILCRLRTSDLLSVVYR